MQYFKRINSFLGLENIKLPRKNEKYNINKLSKIRSLLKFINNPEEDHFRYVRIRKNSYPGWLVKNVLKIGIKRIPWKNLSTAQ